MVSGTKYLDLQLLNFQDVSAPEPCFKVLDQFVTIGLFYTKFIL